MSQGIRLARSSRLAELSASLGGGLDAGLSARSVDRVVVPRAAEAATDLVLFTSARFEALARECPGVVLCSAELGARLPAGNRWQHEHPEWVLAELLDAAQAAADEPPAAAIDSSAELGSGAVVLPGASVGPGSSVGPNAVVYGNVAIGARVSIGAGAVIGRPGFGWVTGPDGRLRRMPQLGGVVVEDDVEIGALSSVDSGTLAPTRIGRGAKLDAHVHVGHNAEIGAGCLIAAQSGFAGSVVLEPGVLVGGQVGVKDHVRVGAGARLAAKSGVIGDVAAGATVAGFPAVPRVRWLRAMARLLSRSSG